MAQLTRNRKFMRKNVTVDNLWVVAYSADLLRKFITHMNAELCISKVKSIKYLFKHMD